MVLVNRTSRRPQSGLTLIEVLIAIVVALVLTTLAVGMIQRDQQRMDNANAGEWLRVVAGAAKAYQAKNRDALIAAAGPTTPATVTPAQLAPFLPTGFSNTNVFGQSYSVRFIEPTAGQLDGIVLTTGGDVLSGLDLIHIAGAAGGGAGYIDPSAPANARGPKGNWLRPLAAFGAGPGVGHSVYALFYDAATTLNADGEYLSRVAVSGQPELNRMSAAIDMANNAIANASTITANGVVTAAAGIRANQISVGHNAFGAVPYPYETIQAAPGTNMRFSIGTAEKMVVGATGVAVAGDQSVTGRVTANQVSVNEAYAAGWYRTTGGGGWYSEAYGGGIHMTDPTWVRTYNGKSFYSSAEIRGNRLQSEGRITSGEYVQINGVATAGAACSGRVLSLDAAGGVLSCKGGRWTDSGGPGVAKAWVNFNGQACSPYCAIRASYNVASVQRLTVGDYIVNLATPMLDAGSAIQGSGAWSSGSHSFNFITTYPTGTQQIRVYATEAGSRNGYWYKTDLETVSVTVHR